MAILTVAVALAAGALAACGAASNSDAPGNSAAQPAAPAPIRHFANSSEFAQAPALAQHFVDFSFDYPSIWVMDPSVGAPTASDFVSLARRDANGLPIESFEVSWFATDSPQAYPQILTGLEAPIRSMPGYQRVSLGEPTAINGLPGTQLTWSATGNSNGRPVNIFGRTVLLQGPETSGVVVAMVTADISGEIHSVADVGVKGQLPVILNSFRFGTPNVPVSGGPTAPTSGASNAPASGAGDAGNPTGDSGSSGGSN